MGAWSYQVLTNDTALDLMGDLVTSKDIKTTIYNILHKKYDVYEFTLYGLSELLLAVEIIDISLNGIDEEILGSLYDYDNWFKKVENTPMGDLRNEAIHAIHVIQVIDEKSGWRQDVKEDRKQLLIEIESRLKGTEVSI